MKTLFTLTPLVFVLSACGLAGGGACEPPDQDPFPYPPRKASAPAQIMLASEYGGFGIIDPVRETMRMRQQQQQRQWMEQQLLLQQMRQEDMQRRMLEDQEMQLRRMERDQMRYRYNW